ncbi:aminotransferase class I/II-fold pyridoxal phosphate-dependent enzyme [Mycetocola manganoxydans]|uniref:cysteine-S-conjugate beta-lyase n=1 Tax=Mycetocola manganoxydans TaxID=699879 RepID=A0A3L6ZXN1_9MICO|nr:aminotransferase class I/II-fold pyridoxal phosphate-dependent enzyme [Mycetocola manganoxydans]RLP72465.1 aminotransferase class I/II-fold pyridoxal phosphate-dependent enzyme [Mycetocola manganoxydans]GHD40155.1 cystathionine beta-lyase [Mycetocola manganoxydans]
MTDVSSDPTDVLRARTSEKWAEHPDDVLPLFVAEMDYPLADPIRRVLHEAIDRGDTGYVASANPLAGAFCGFAGRRWNWDLTDATVLSTADVSMGIVEILRAVTAPGDRVAITPPVYPPFFDLVAEAGASVTEVPLVDTGDGPRLDLDGLETAFAGGARAFVLCNPHNPLGLLHSRAELARVAELALAFNVRVISDEIHAPLTHPGATFVPYLSASTVARENGFALHSASKAWNIAGLKCALMVAEGEEPKSILAGLPVEVTWRTGQFGMLASTAAYREGEGWLDGARASIKANLDLLDELRREHLPDVSWRRPDAGYLAWLDFRGRGWGDDPAARILEQARVALSPGTGFGSGGSGWARINVACSPELLTEAVRRIAAIPPGPQRQ